MVDSPRAVNSLLKSAAFLKEPAYVYNGVKSSSKTQRVRMGLQLLLIMRLWILSVVDMTVCGAGVLEILGD